MKPITLMRRDYISGVVDLTNKSGLPAFVVVDVLEHVLEEARKAADLEIKRDEATWRQSLSEVTNDGGQEDK